MVGTPKMRSFDMYFWDIQRIGLSCEYFKKDWNPTCFITKKLKRPVPTRPFPILYENNFKYVVFNS